jgi:hypothetical protein
MSFKLATHLYRTDYCRREELGNFLAALFSSHVPWIAYEYGGILLAHNWVSQGCGKPFIVLIQ